MILIPCPHCGPRNEDEFVCWSEVVPRPADPATLTDAEWTDHVYNHANLKGWVQEQWWHEHGCRRWILVERNTLTHEIRGTEPAHGGHKAEPAQRLPRDGSTAPER